MGQPAGARGCVAVFSAPGSSFHSVIGAHPAETSADFTDEKIEIIVDYERAHTKDPSKKGMEFASRKQVRDPLSCRSPLGRRVRMVVAGKSYLFLIW